MDITKNWHGFNEVPIIEEEVDPPSEEYDYEDLNSIESNEEGHEPCRRKRRGCKYEFNKEIDMQRPGFRL